MKTCRICKVKYTPVRAIQPVCLSFTCQVAYARTSADKAAHKRKLQEKNKDQARKVELRPRSEWMKIAQSAFNAYIRRRDQVADYNCISSGRQLDWSGNKVDAGHYRSVGSAPHLRFDERNCHAQRKQDNLWLSGNAVDYRIGLIQRIGMEQVDDLEANQDVKKYTIDDLQSIILTYKLKLKELSKREFNSEWIDGLLPY